MTHTLIPIAGKPLGRRPLQIDTFRKARHSSKINIAAAAALNQAASAAGK